jgi:DnaA family protein
VTPHQFTLDILPVPQPSLENFVPGANGAVLAALRDALAGRGPEFLHLWGANGSGRSHLLTAVALAAGIEARAPGTVPAFRPQQRVYVVDDVQRLDETGQAALFALQNAVREAQPGRVAPGAGAHGCVLLTAADLPPTGLQLREDVRTRLAWGLVFAVQPIAEPERAAALEAHARARGARVDAELVPYMLTRLPRDMRTLISVLDALDAYALARQRALTVPLLREWLRARQAQNAPPGGDPHGRQ